MSAPPAPFGEKVNLLYRRLLLLPDGNLYVEQEGDQVVAVTKREKELWLSILPAGDPRSFFVQSAIDLTGPGRVFRRK